jgi:hypothetical protein
MKNRAARPLARLGMSPEDRERLVHIRNKPGEIVKTVLTDDEEDLPPPKRTRERVKLTPDQETANWVPVKDSDISDLLDVLHSHEHMLRTRESDFLFSAAGQVVTKGGLTLKQYKWLQDIAERVG